MSDVPQTTSRFSMPLTQLGSKKYYLGIFFKVFIDHMYYRRMFERNKFSFCYNLNFFNLSNFVT